MLSARASAFGVFPRQIEKWYEKKDSVAVRDGEGDRGWSGMGKAAVGRLPELRRAAYPVDATRILVAALVLVLLPGDAAAAEHAAHRGRFQQGGSARGVTQLSKVGEFMRKKAIEKGGGAGMTAMNEGGSSEEEINWLLAKDQEGLPVLVIIFLVLGFVCMTVGAIFSLVMAVSYDGDSDLRPMGPVYYYIIFFVASVSALVYYSMWSETGVMHVHDGEHVRIVFPARYLDWAVTSPLMLVGLGLLGNAALPAILGMVGRYCTVFFLCCLGASLSLSVAVVVAVSVSERLRLLMCLCVSVISVSLSLPLSLSLTHVCIYICTLFLSLSLYSVTSS